MPDILNYDGLSYYHHRLVDSQDGKTRAAVELIATAINVLDERVTALEQGGGTAHGTSVVYSASSRAYKERYASGDTDITALMEYGTLSEVNA